MQAPAYARNVLPEPPPFLPPPPPPQAMRRWVAPVAAFGLVLALVAVTGAGSVLVTRLVAAGISMHIGNDRAGLRFPPSPSGPTAPGAADVVAMHSLLESTPTTPGVTVDKALAEKIVTALWPIRERAIYTRDLTLLSTFETGAALEGDTAMYGGQPCGCAGPLPRAAQWFDLFVPRQTAYPANFLVEVPIEATYGRDPGVEFLAFSRVSALSLWNVVLATGYQLHTSGPPEIGVAPAPAGTFTIPLPPTKADLAALPAHLAAYYGYWALHGKAPSRTMFAPGFFTSQKGSDVFVHGETDGVDGIHHVLYSVDSKTDAEWSFGGQRFDVTPHQGWILSCGTVRYEDVFTAATGGAPLSQPLNLSSWGPTLAAGRYSQITQLGIHESCFVTDPSGGPTIVLGSDGGTTRSSGVAVTTP
jgi:hypothetical protein